MDDIVTRNPSLEGNLIPIVRPRPYLIVGATILEPVDGKAENIYPLEITPMYTGVRRDFPVGTSRIERIGGGYIETFGYDAEVDEQSWSENGASAIIENRKNRFTLSDMVGTSGAAPVQIVADYYVRGRLAIFPQYEYATPTQTSKELTHGDGGHADNLGIFPLLARQVENIIVFVNAPGPFLETKREKWKGSKTSDINEDIRALFEDSKTFPNNRVFVDGLDGLTASFETNGSEEGTGPPVHCGTFNIVSGGNDWYSVSEFVNDKKDPYLPRICWVYLSRVSDWVDSLPRCDKGCKYAHRIDERIGEFVNFPHMETVYQDFGQAADLDRPFVYGLYHLSAWTLCSSALKIKNHFGLPDLPMRTDTACVSN